MTAPHEIELKLEVPLEGLRKLEQSKLLRGNHLPGKGVDVVSVYFDTGKLNLRKKGVSLRVRQMGGRYLQTVKRNEPGNHPVYEGGLVPSPTSRQPWPRAARRIG